MTGTAVYRRLKFIPDTDKFKSAIRYDLMDSDLRMTADRLSDFAEKHLEPIIAGVVADVTAFNPDADPIEVSVGNTAFRGKILSRLEGIITVAPYYITAGNAFSSFDFSAEDPLAVFYAEYLKEQALEYARKNAVLIFSELMNSTAVSSLNPGAGDMGLWNITELKTLFTLLEDSGCQLDVSLTDSCLIIPNKSIAGIFYPTEKELFTCSACKRKDCPSRKKSGCSSTEPQPGIIFT